MTEDDSQTRPDLPTADQIEFLHAMAGEQVWKARFLDNRYTVEITDCARPHERHFYLADRWHIRVSDHHAEPDFNTVDPDNLQSLRVWGSWVQHQPHTYCDTPREAAETAAAYVRLLTGTPASRSQHECAPPELRSGTCEIQPQVKGTARSSRP